MKLVSWLRTFLAFVFHRSHIEREMEYELRAHLESRAEDLERQGLPRVEAERQARIEFGGYERYKEECREALGSRLLGELVADTRYGLRQLRRSPGFTAVAVLTLALGIGANTAIFSVIDAALLRPLPYDRPEQLVNASTFHLNGNPEVIAPDFRNWHNRSSALTALEAFGFGFNPYSSGANLTGTGEPVRVHVVPVTVGFFPMLGVQPILGRSFTSDEGQRGHEQVALLSAAIWRQQLGGSREVLNKTIDLDGAPYTIIGVMPAGLLYPPGDVWVPEVLDSTNSLPGNADWPMLYLVGRLKPGVSPAEARADLQVLMHRLDPQFSVGRQRARSRLHVQIVPLRQLLAGDVGHLLFILLAAVGFVLLIACANLANLLLARAAARGKEIAVRAALGAARCRLIRQFLTESLLLAFLGGTLGSAVGLWAERGMKVLAPPELPAAATLNLRVLAFVFAVSVGAVIFFGLVPALAASRVEVNEALKEGGAQAGLARGAHRVRGLLVIAQVGLALVLLTGAGLVARSFVRLTEEKLGFDPHHLLLAEMYLPVTVIDQPQRQAGFFHDVLERLRVLPGVKNAAATTHYPVSIFNELASNVLVRVGPPVEADKPVSVAHISPQYFTTFEIPLVKGRFFTDQDAAQTAKVAILSESEAHRLFGDRDPSGNEISYDGPKGPWRTVVGVVADTRNYQLEREPWPEIFVPYQQEPSLVMTVVLRTSGDPMRTAATLRKAVASVDPYEPVASLETMDDVVQKVVAPRQFKLVLLGSFAVLALVLAAIGLYAVVSFAVTERTHEIGVRRALGAEQEDVLRLVVGQGLKLTAIGIAVGVAGALGLMRFLSGLLYGVKPTDPVTFAAVAALLLVVALFACYVPARRATKVDPMVALRHE